MWGAIWRLHLESPDALVAMARSAAVTIPDASLAPYVKADDGIVLCSYDEASRSARIWALGIVTRAETPDAIAVRWALVDRSYTPTPQGRPFWRDRAFRYSYYPECYRLPEAFNETFPDLFANEEPEVAPEKVYRIQPEAHFRLDASHPVAPERLMPHVGRIRTGAEWEAEGLTPYSYEEVGGHKTSRRNPFLHDGLDSDTSSEDDDDDEYWPSQTVLHNGSFDDGERVWSFTPGEDASYEPFDKEDRKRLRRWAEAIKQQKRHVGDSCSLYALRQIGVPYEEISNFNKGEQYAAEGRLAFERMDYAAVDFFQRAVQEHPHDHICQRSLFDARIKAGDLSVIADGLEYYKEDMHNAMHGGVAVGWLRLAMDVAKDYRLALDVTLNVLTCSHTMKARSAEDRRWNKKTRESFVKRLGTLKGFVSKALCDANRHRPGELRSLLNQIATANPAKAKKIEELLNEL